MATSPASVLADDYWAFFRNTAQLWNIDRGDVDQLVHWEDLSGDGVDSRVTALEGFARRAEVLQGEDVSDGDRTLLAAVAFGARSNAVMLPYQRDLTLVGGPMNVTALLSELVPAYHLKTARHGHDYVTKLRGVPSFIDGLIDGLRAGLAAGRGATARAVASTIAELDQLLGAAPGDDPIAQQSPPAELDPDSATRWRARVVDAVRGDVRPAMGRLRVMLHDELLPRARADNLAGMCWLPSGSDDYQALLWAATSTELTTDAIHELGREQLARLDNEYRRLGAAALGVNDAAEVRARLRDDPSLRLTSAAAVLATATATLDRALSEAPRWFGRLPTAACTVVGVRGGGPAYYTGPSPDGGRGGTCHVNLSDPAFWTQANLEATIFHESVPGHHLHVALAGELGLHPVLGELELTSFGEGWALYAERLADEMSLYSGPLQQLGMLTLDSLRAARLVIDTGIHAMGWSRDQALETLAGCTALTRRALEAEIDRYISDPGQATSYMVGRLELERLRQVAEDRLDDRFALSAFHDAVLSNGTVPLHELARIVTAWIESDERGSAPTD